MGREEFDEIPVGYHINSKLINYLKIYPLEIHVLKKFFPIARTHKKNYYRRKEIGN